VYEKWKEYGKGNTPFWQNLATEMGYPSGEVLRSSFKRERKKLETEKDSDNSDSKFPKILLLDIETTPLVVFSWGVYDQKIMPDAVIHDWFMLSWSGKWLFDHKAFSEVLKPEEVLNKDDKRIVEKVWKVLDEADIVITYNGVNFDMKRMNTRFLYHGLQPPTPYRNIDLYQTAKSTFGFTSNKLDFVNKFLNLRHKIHTGFDLWVDCYNGKKEALKLIDKYNINDVVILEDLYVKLRPWIKNHPNISVYQEIDEPQCPNCGSMNLEEKNYQYTNSAKYASYRCECGCICRGKSNQLTKDKKSVLLVK